MFAAKMKVYRSLSEIPHLPGSVVTIGTFDGLHAGHRAIFEQVIQLAQKSKGESVVLTFEPHPRLILSPSNDPIFVLQTLDEKLTHLRELGIEHAVVLNFTKELASTHWHDFVKTYLVDTLQAQHLVIGYDHHFGKNREGTIQQLRLAAPEFGFEVHEIPAFLIDETKVSSTKIRKALLEGNVKEAAHLLGYPYVLKSTVTEGRKLGRTIGFPTANLAMPDGNKLVPANGVYAVHVVVNNQLHKGMLNIGVRPTFGGNERTIEVHIFDFNSEIYGQQIQINFVERLRNEQTFTGIDALVEQLEKDRKAALQVLA